MSRHTRRASVAANLKSPAALTISDERRKALSAAVRAVESWLVGASLPPDLRGHLALLALECRWVAALAWVESRPAPTLTPALFRKV